MVFAGCCVFLAAQSRPTLCDPMNCSPRGSSVHGASPGKNTGVGCQALLQVIFPTQGSSPGHTPTRISHRYTCVPSFLKLPPITQCSLQHFSQLLGHGSSLDIQWQEWIQKLWYIYTVECYSVLKKNAFESVLMRWKNLEHIIQREVSQKEKEFLLIFRIMYLGIIP